MANGINSKGTMLPWTSQDDDEDTASQVEHTMSLSEFSQAVSKVAKAAPATKIPDPPAKNQAKDPLPDIVSKRIAAANSKQVKPSGQSVVEKKPQGKFSPSSIVGQRDSRFSDISLLSHFGFYDFTSIGIRTFNALDISKLYRSVKEKSTRLQIDTMSACLTSSAYDLTIPDYHYLLCWQRISSYKKTPITVEYECMDEGHRGKVMDGETAEETLTNVVHVSMGDLKYKEMDVEACREFMTKFYETYGIVLAPRRIADLVELEEFEEDPDDTIVDLAGHISYKHHGETLAERIEFLEQKLTELPPEFFAEFEEWKSVSDHGVYSEIESTCKECGSKRDIHLLIDLRTFLT